MLTEIFGGENTELLFERSPVEGDEDENQELGTDEMENKLKGSRGVRWGRAIGAPHGNLYKDLIRKYSGKTKAGAKVVPKVYFVFDKTLASKLEDAGIDGSQAKKLAQALAARLHRSKKVQLEPKAIAGIIKKVGLKDKETEVLDALNYRGKSGEYIGPVKAPPDYDPMASMKGQAGLDAQKKRYGKKDKPLKESRPRKQKKKTIQESKKTDPWDSIRARMKELSGIK